MGIGIGIALAIAMGPCFQIFRQERVKSRRVCRKSPRSPSGCIEEGGGWKLESWETELPEFIPPATMKLMQRWCGDRLIQACSDPNEFYAILDDLPEPVAGVLCADLLVGDVMNGGFDQYFQNSFGITINRAILTMRALGLIDHANAARKAKMVFGEEFPDDHSSRMDKMDVLPESQFDEATDEFYAAEDSHPEGIFNVLQSAAKQLLVGLH